MSNVFFTADEHHDHKNIIAHCGRPFSSVEEQTEVIIQRHNQKVKPGDRTYHLGDMFWETVSPDFAACILSRLNGQHYFVNGNHGEKVIRSVAHLFTWVKQMYKLDLKEFKLPKAVLCHYSMNTWQGKENGNWHLFGHSHGQLPGVGLSFDVGVDAWNFEPVSLEEVAKKMTEKTYREYGSFAELAKSFIVPASLDTLWEGKICD